MKTPGLFITFEGGEGSGKTTQIATLVAALEAQGRKIIKTREPGGTPEAEKIRNFLVNRDGGSWTPTAECLLFYAARNQHVETLIKPALVNGDIVISDRFADSTVAYQCYGHGVPRQMIADLHRLAINNFNPHLTFILDIAPQDGLQRAGKRQQQTSANEDRFERLNLDFHERLRQGYLDIAKAEPSRCAVINAAQAPEKIAAEIFSIVSKKL